MNRLDMVNALGVAAALGGALMVTPFALSDPAPQEPSPAPEPKFSRVLSASVVADELLLELCEPSRIVGFTAFSQRSGPQAYRFAGKPTVPSITNVEAILALAPDLVLVHSVGDPRPVQRLREAGVKVLDFGPVEGVAKLLSDVRELAAVLGHPDRGERLARRLTEDLALIAEDILHARRARGLYAKVLGNQVYGGSVGSSFHDILTYAGVNDVAAGRYRRHPVYTAEQLLELDPPMIILNTGTGELLCARPGFDRLTACKSPKGIIEIPPELLESAALGIVEAARAVREKVYGPRSGTAAP